MKHPQDTQSKGKKECFCRCHCPLKEEHNCKYAHYTQDCQHCQPHPSQAEKKKEKYDKKAFRTVKHGIEEENGYCRMCKETFKDTKKAYQHAKVTLHTVDVYREHWIEYTSYVKPL